MDGSGHGTGGVDGSGHGVLGSGPGTGGFPGLPGTSLAKQHVAEQRPDESPEKPTSVAPTPSQISVPCTFAISGASRQTTPRSASKHRPPGPPGAPGEGVVVGMPGGDEVGALGSSPPEALEPGLDGSVLGSGTPAILPEQATSVNAPTIVQNATMTRERMEVPFISGGSSLARGTCPHTTS